MYMHPSKQTETFLFTHEQKSQIDVITFEQELSSITRRQFCPTLVTCNHFPNIVTLTFYSDKLATFDTFQ